MSRIAGCLRADKEREGLASSFAAVWSKHANSARLALPLLRTANILYDDCGMHSLPESHPFPGETTATSHGLQYLCWNLDRAVALEMMSARSGAASIL